MVDYKSEINLLFSVEKQIVTDNAMVPTHQFSYNSQGISESLTVSVSQFGVLEKLLISYDLRLCYPESAYFLCYRHVFEYEH